MGGAGHCFKVLLVQRVSIPRVCICTGYCFEGHYSKGSLLQQGFFCPKGHFAEKYLEKKIMFFTLNVISLKR